MIKPHWNHQLQESTHPKLLDVLVIKKRFAITKMSGRCIKLVRKPVRPTTAGRLLPRASREKAGERKMARAEQMPMKPKAQLPRYSFGKDARPDRIIIKRPASLDLESKATDFENPGMTHLRRRPPSSKEQPEIRPRSVGGSACLGLFFADFRYSFAGPKAQDCRHNCLQVGAHLSSRSLSRATSHQTPAR